MYKAYMIIRTSLVRKQKEITRKPLQNSSILVTFKFGFIKILIFRYSINQTIKLSTNLILNRMIDKESNLF